MRNPPALTQSGQQDSGLEASVWATIMTNLHSFPNPALLPNPLPNDFT